MERFLYRLSISELRERFWLKGALLFDLWFEVPHRRTRDADFLGFGPHDAAVLGGRWVDLSPEDSIRLSGARCCNPWMNT